MASQAQRLLALTFTSAALTSSVFATVTIVDLGTSNPPGTLGGYTMTAFPLDARTERTFVTSVPSPLGGDVSFTQVGGVTPFSREVRKVPNSWTTWGQGYTRSVYPNMADPSTLELLMPAQTTAFYLYVESDDFGSFEAVARDEENDTSSLFGFGEGGSVGFGFYASPGTFLSSVQISVLAPQVPAGEFVAATQISMLFAAGEFGISKDQIGGQVPEASTMTAGLAVAGLGAFSFFRNRRAKA